jgi:hypothetical protein
VLGNRPEVRLASPPRARPGGNLEVVLEVVCAEDTPIEGLELSFEGRESVAGGEAGSPPILRALVAVTRGLAGSGVLDRGSSIYRARFDVPDHAPPSYSGQHVDIAYVLALRILTPHSVDAPVTFPVQIEPRRGPRLPASPIDEHWQGNLDLEVALDDRVYAPGDRIEGALAAGFNDESLLTFDLASDPRAHLALVGVERAGVMGERMTEHRIELASLPMRERWSAAIPFSLPLPEDTPPSFFSPLSALSWYLECQVRSPGRSEASLRIPILITALEGALRPGGKRPPIGDERVHRALRDLGEPYGLTVEEAGAWLAGRLGGCSVRLRWSWYREELTAEIAYPDLGLDLAYEVKRRLPNPPERTRRSREPSQLRDAGFSAVENALAAFEEVEMDDRRAVVKAHVSARKALWRARVFVADVAGLSAALGVMRARIPPPSSMAAHAPAWRAFADAVGATLSLGGMRIRDGAWRGHRVDLVTHFDAQGEPTETLVSVAVDPPLPGPEPIVVPAGAQALGEALAGEVREMRLTREAVWLALAGPVADPARLASLLDDATALVKQLWQERRLGPYR